MTTLSVRSLTISIIVICICIYGAAFAEPVGMDNIRTAAGRFLSPAVQGAAKAMPVTILDIRAVYEDDTLVAYVADLDPEGFVILAPDTDLRPIIGYSGTGQFPPADDPDNVLLQLVRTDMSARLKNLSIEDPELTRYFESNRQLWDVYRSEGLDIDADTEDGDILGPLLATSWHQMAPYNSLCPRDPSTGERSLVGCVAVAAAQILQYWRHPANVELTQDDVYDATYRSGNIKVPDDAELLNFATFEYLNDWLSPVGYSNDVQGAARLLFTAGIKFHTRYSSASSSSAMPVSVYRNLGFETATIDTNWKRVYGTVIDNIRDKWPVVLAIVSPLGSHAVVVDGYDERLDQFHMNLGWEGTPGAWYSLPHVGYYTVITDIIYNLTPSSGTVSGRVTDTAGSPVANAVIHAAPLDIRTTTNDTGDYTLSVPAEKTFSVTASFASAPSVTRTDVSVSVDGERSLDFSIEPGEQSTVAHYHFDGDGADTGGSNRDLTVDPELITWDRGRYGGAITVGAGNFSGSAPIQGSGHDFLYPGSGDLTVEAWVRFPNSGRNIVLYTDSYALIADQGELVFQIFDGASWLRVTGYGVVPEQEWVHIAGIYRYRSGLSVYVNGIEAATASTNSVPLVSTGEAYIGTLYSESSPVLYTGLSIDELRISTTALPPEDFLGISAPGVITDTLTDPDVEIIRDIIVTETAENSLVLAVSKPESHSGVAGTKSFAITVSRQAGSPEHSSSSRSYTETVTLDPKSAEEYITINDLDPGAPYVIAIAQCDDTTGKPFTTHVVSAQTLVQFSDEDLDGRDPFIKRDSGSQFLFDNDLDLIFNWSSWEREGAVSYNVFLYLDDFTQCIDMRQIEENNYSIAGMANRSYAVEIKPLDVAGVELGTMRSRFIRCMSEHIPSPGVPKITAELSDIKP